MDQQLKNIRLTFDCPANWDDMTTAAGGRHCASCNKTVFDFTDARPYEFLQILAENNNKICGRFRADQMAPARIPVWKKWLSAALVLIGINLMNDQAYAQGKPLAQKHPISKNRQVKFPPPVVVGDVEVQQYDKMPEFPGGDEAMYAYFSKNLNAKNSPKTGKVYVSFNVEKDGTLQNIKIEKGLNKLTDNEVIKVLRSSPKWKPAVLNGQPIVYKGYVIPVKFSKD